LARLVLDGLELQDVAAGIWFDIVEGGLDDLPMYRGEDDIVPSASGRDPGAWIADVRKLGLFGHVWGVGANAAARRAAYRAKVDALMAKMDPTSLVALVAHPPNEGLATGQTATLSSLRAVGSTPGPIRGWDGARAFELKLECIDSPPAWAIAGP
jgi:hypothetical protein